jgi:hypothetical protein
MYCGTTDVAWPALFDTLDAAWDAYRDTKLPGEVDWEWVFHPEPIGPAEPVEVYSDYGNGFWWPATATRNRLLTRLNWDEFEEHRHRGAPDWVAHRVRSR